MTALRGEDLVRQSFNEAIVELMLLFNASLSSLAVEKARGDWRRKKMYIRLLSGLPVVLAYIPPIISVR